MRGGLLRLRLPSEDHLARHEKDCILCTGPSVTTPTPVAASDPEHGAAAFARRHLRDNGVALLLGRVRDPRHAARAGARGERL
jgi:hypothetical protein